MLSISRIRSSEFVRHNSIYLVAAVAVGALNYLYYPVLGRLMDPSSFGEIQTLVSILLQATAYLTVMGLVTVNIVANHEDKATANRIVGELERLALVIACVLLAGTIIGNSLLTRYFHFESGVGFVLLSLAIVITVPYMIRSAYVNGKKLFALNAWSSITAAGSKLVFSAVLVAAGLGTVGAVFGIVLAQIAALLIATYFATRHGFVDTLRTKLFRKPDMTVVTPQLKYAGLVLAGSLSITILYSMDILVVKHYFDPHTAGLYASVATVARVLFFATVPISQVMMPSVRLQNQGFTNTKILIKSAVLMAGVGGAVLLVFWLMPEFIVGALMGNQYRAYAYLLPQLGLALFIISGLNLGLTYYMALRTYAAGALAVVGVGVTYIFMLFNHGSLQGVVTSLLYGSFVMSALFLGWVGYRARAWLPALGRDQLNA